MIRALSRETGRVDHLGAEPVRALLLRQITRLDRVVDRGMSNDAATALSLSKTMRAYLRDLNTAPLGAGEIARLIGPNGGPLSTYAVDDVCRGVEGLTFTALVGGCVVDADERRVA